MEQGSLFGDEEEQPPQQRLTWRQADEQRKAALAQVAANTDEEWREDALRVVQQVCINQATFICDDIWGLGLRSTHNDKALGPVMMKAARNGWCRKTGLLRPSKRSHLSGKPVWESLLYNKEMRL